jgi:VanZ family protein
MLLHRLSLLLALTWMAGIFYLSHQPTLDVPSLFENQDKVMHFGAYGLLGVLLLGAMPLEAAGYRSRQIALATLIASLYGISDEFHQSFVPGRSPDVMDWLADTSGAFLAALLLAQLSRSVSGSRGFRRLG